MSVKQFKAAVAEHVEADSEDAVKFDLHKTRINEQGEEEILETREMVALNPDPAQVAMLMASLGRGSTQTDRIAGMVNFFVNVFDTDSAEYLEQRLLDRKDGFGPDQVEDILAFLMEEWSARPTQRPSDSTSSPPSAGPSSTQPTPQPTF